MSTNLNERENVRDLIRQAIRDVLGDLNSGIGAPASSGETRYVQAVPEERELTFRVCGSERSISLLESALNDDPSATLEIAIGKDTGPKVRVQARR